MAPACWSVTLSVLISAATYLRAPAAAEIAEAAVGNPLLSDSFERMAGHLRANGVDLEQPEQGLALGPWLDIDPESERFIGDDEADRRLTRAYRSGFRVPDFGA